MVTINLLPSAEREPRLKATLKAWRAVIILAVVLAFAAGGLGFVSFNETRAGEVLAQEQQSLKIEIANYGGVEAQAKQLQTQLSAVEALLGKHVRWSLFFSMIEENTKSDVEFITVTGSPQGGVVLTGRATSMETVAQQLRAFETATGVSGVALGKTERKLNTETEAAEISFSLSLQLRESLFYQ